MWVVDNDQNYTDGTKINNSNLNYKSLSFTYPDIDVVTEYIWDLKAQYPYDIISVVLQSDIGTVTGTVMINREDVRGLAEIDATTVKTKYTATGLNSVEIGDTVIFAIDELIDSPTTLHIGLLIKIT